MGDKFRIAFFGSSLVSAYWNGAATYYRGIIKAMHTRGHRITFYEPDAFERQKHRDIPNPFYAKSVVYSAKDKKELCNCLKQAGKADIIIKASGVGVFDEYLEQQVIELKTCLNKIIFWDVDAPATLDRMDADINDHFRPLVSEYDLILTYGGGCEVVNNYLRLGAKDCVPIYNALDAETHFPVKPVRKFESDLAFLGNRMPDREQRVFEFFFKTAKMLPARKFLLGGNGWQQNSPAIKNVKYLGHIYTSEHNAFNCTPLAVLNISRNSMARYGFSPATRVFEAAGAGACLITDNWKGLEMFLKPEVECFAADNSVDVAEIISGLTHEQAHKIGLLARERILAEHTYVHRAKQLEEYLYSMSAARQEVI